MPADPSTRTRLLLLSSGVTSFLLLGGGQAVLGAALPTYEKRLGIDTALSSWLVSSMGIGGMFGLIVLYFLGHHIMPRMSLAVMAAGAALLAAAPGFQASVAGGALFGLGFASTAAMFNSRVLVGFGPRGPSMVSLLNAGYSVGAIVAPLLFVALGSDPVVIYGLVALLTALTIFITGPEGKTPAARPVAGGNFRLHLPILGFGMVAVGIEVSLSGLGPTALIRAGHSPEEAAGLLSAFFLAFLGGRLVLTLLANNLAPFAIYTAAALLTAVFSAGAALIDPGWFFIPIGFCAGLYFPGFFMTGVAKMGNDARVAPVILGVTQIGAFAAPLIVAALLPDLGERGFFWLIAGLSAAMALLALANYRRMSA